MMKTIGHGLSLSMTAAWLVMPGMAGAVGRDKLLAEPGVYDRFAAFRIDGE
jgi:hypothetical protein